MKFQKQQYPTAKHHSPDPDDENYLSSRKVFTDKALVTFIKSKKYKCINSHIIDKDAYETAKGIYEEEDDNLKIKKKHKRRYSAEDSTNSQLINELFELQDKMREQAKRIMNNSEVKYTRTENMKDKEMFQKLRKIEKSRNLIGILSKQNVLQRVMEKAPARAKKITEVVQKKDTQSFISLDEISFSESKVCDITKRQEDIKREKLKEIMKKKNAKEAYECERKKQTWLAFKEVQRKQLKCKKNKIIESQKRRQKRQEKKEQAKIKRKREEECMLAFRSPSQRTKVLIDYQNKFKELTNLWSLGLNK